MVAGQESAEDLMKETIIHADGTEPTVINRWCCDGLCNQGRTCPGAPAQAEAATDIGMDESPEALGSFVIAFVLVIAITATISFFVGYFW